MIQPLTPQEKNELNAWIAEHVYRWCWHEAIDYLPRRLLPPDYNPISTGPHIPNYTDEWSAAAEAMRERCAQLVRQEVIEG